MRLKINYNCTRRTAWDAKLGFHSYPGPLPIILKTIHVKGGIVGHIKVCIARLYPLRYMEKQDSHISKSDALKSLPSKYFYCFNII